LRKHVDANHAIIIKRFDEEVNSLMNEKRKGNHNKKRPNIFGRFIPKTFVVKDSFKKDDVQQKKVL
jgi:hypothetical protein